MFSVFALTARIDRQSILGMPECQSKRKLTFAYVMKSYTGYLRGTEKAEHTIASYQSDLRLFERFVHEKLSRNPVMVDDLNLSDLKKYAEYLRSAGFHDNTRRRRILTVKRLFEYLTRRGNLDLDLARIVPAPHKVEKVPRVVHAGELLARVKELKAESLLQCRNRTVLWALLETGCLVSEAAKIRASDFDSESRVLNIRGKNARPVPISRDLLKAVQELKNRTGSDILFVGFNRHGPMTQTAMTPRGVELLVRAHEPVLGDVTPRMIRHSVVVQWAKEGHPREKIRDWLGLKTDYAFRAYAPLLPPETKSSS